MSYVYYNNDGSIIAASNDLLTDFANANILEIEFEKIEKLLVGEHLPSEYNVYKNKLVYKKEKVESTWKLKAITFFYKYLRRVESYYNTYHDILKYKVALMTTTPYSPPSKSLYHRPPSKPIHPTRCVNPYLNLTIHPSGKVKVCCMSHKWLTTDSGETTLNNASLLDFWNSKDRKRFIKQLESKIQVPECKACWTEEAAGKDSKRLRDNAAYKHIPHDEQSFPIVLDLGMGNLCNLKCRICSAVHSTPMLAEEAEMLQPNDVVGYMNQDKFRITRESFDPNNSYVWEDIKPFLKNAMRFDFSGGEPFYIDSHWRIIDHCVENDYAKEQIVHYNTNGSIFPQKHIHKLDKFKLVDIQISSDGIGKQFEYLRSGVSFELSEQNIDKFLERKKESKTNWLLGACLSVSAFNVFDFFETYEHYTAKGLGVYVNFVHDNGGIRVLPTEVKNHLIDKLQRTESKYNKADWRKVKNSISSILNNTEFVEEDWLWFCNRFQSLDKVREESFEQTFPEYYKLLKEYINV